MGQPLTDMWRPVGQCFEFGEQRPAINRRGVEVIRADMSLTLPSPWHISHHGAVVMGSEDHLGKRRFYHRKSPPRDTEERRRWEEAQLLFQHVETGDLFVTGVRVEPYGFLEVLLTEGYGIRRLVAGASEDEFLSVNVGGQFTLVFLMAGAMFVVPKGE